jgi:hypothetical protein
MGLREKRNLLVAFWPAVAVVLIAVVIGAMAWWPVDVPSVEDGKIGSFADAGFEGRQAELLDQLVREPLSDQETRQLQILEVARMNDYRFEFEADSAWNEDPIENRVIIDPEGRFAWCRFALPASVERRNWRSAVLSILDEITPEGALWIPSSAIEEAIDAMGTPADAVQEDGFHHRLRLMNRDGRVAGVAAVAVSEELLPREDLALTVEDPLD